MPSIVIGTVTVNLEGSYGVAAMGFIYASRLIYVMCFMPRDYIACITIGGGFLLILSGANGLVGSMLLAVTMFYFGVETLEKQKRE